MQFCGLRVLSRGEAEAVLEVLNRNRPELLNWSALDPTDRVRVPVRNDGTFDERLAPFVVVIDPIVGRMAFYEKFAPDAQAKPGVRVPGEATGPRWTLKQWLRASESDAMMTLARERVKKLAGEVDPRVAEALEVRNAGKVRPLVLDAQSTKRAARRNERIQAAQTRIQERVQSRKKQAEALAPEPVEAEPKKKGKKS